LNSANNLITFEVPKKKTNWGVISSYLGAKEELAPIKVSDIFDCFSYGNKELLESGNSSWASQSHPSFIDAKSEQTLLTLVCQSEGTQVAVRTLCMQLPSKEDRNFMVSGFRMMRENNPLASHHGRGAAPLQQKLLAPQMPLHKAVSPAPAVARVESKEAPSPVGPVSRRRVTKRDAAIEETRARKLSDASSPNPVVSRSSLSADVSVDDASSTATTRETAAKMLSSPLPTVVEREATLLLKNQLADERINSDRFRTQTLLLQNELHERDEEIVALKKERLVLEQSMRAKQIMVDNDAHVRIQIGQKLEQTILDREELKELNEALSHEIFHLKQKLLAFDGGNVGVGPGGPLTEVTLGQGRL